MKFKVFIVPFLVITIVSLGGCHFISKNVEIRNIDLNRKNDNKLSITLYTDKNLYSVERFVPGSQLSFIVNPDKYEKPVEKFYVDIFIDKDSFQFIGKFNDLYVYKTTAPVRVEEKEFNTKKYPGFGKAASTQYERLKENFPEKIEKHIFYDLTKPGKHHILFWIEGYGMLFKKVSSNLVLETFRYKNNTKQNTNH